MDLYAQNPDILRDIIAGNAAEEIRLWDGRIVCSRPPVQALLRSDITSDGPLINGNNKLVLRIGLLLEKGKEFSTRTRKDGHITTRIWSLS